MCVYRNFYIYKEVKHKYIILSFWIFCILKFIYSEKATKFCKISTLILSSCTIDKSKAEISQNFVALSEHTSFTVWKNNYFY